MKSFRIVLSISLYCSVIFLISCTSNRAPIILNSTNYLNINYIKCLENKLPCECEKIANSYFTMTLDTNSLSKFFGVTFLKFDKNELERYYIKRESLNKYQVFIMNEDSINSIIGSLIFKTDTVLFFDNKNQISYFVNCGNFEIFDESNYRKQNIILLNKSFVKRGYSPLDTILKQDSLWCSCNRDLGKVNLIGVEGGGKTWIIEQNGDSIFIFDCIYSSNIRSIPPKIVKKLIKSFKW